MRRDALRGVELDDYVDVVVVVHASRSPTSSPRCSSGRL
jgi:hypothetical protein